MLRVGIDIGGTFTDVVLVDDDKGRLEYTKTPTVPEDLAEGLLNGMDKVSRKEDVFDFIIHGTTVGTNALIEKEGAKTGLITTEGFKDVLEFARWERPKEGMYKPWVSRPEPLVPRNLRLEVPERLDGEGKVVKDLDKSKLEENLEFFKKNDAEVIAVCLLFSFLNSKHEKEIKEYIDKNYPEFYVSLSSEVAPEFREYERTSTTVIDAYLKPILSKYIENLRNRIDEKYDFEQLLIMTGEGGVIPPERAKREAVESLNSGPAAGVVASSYFGSLQGTDNVICADAGGTSFDLSIVKGGTPSFTLEGEASGYPINLPFLDIETVGIAGGSVAWITEGGVLDVGPMSQGADPGPACYDKGGEKATLTDANLILNRIGERTPFEEISLNRDLAEKSVRDIEEKFDLSTVEAAQSIVDIAIAKMNKEIMSKMAEEGLDPREFSLVIYGGMGPLHGCELAQEIGIPEVIIPPFPGAFSAFGLLATDIEHSYVRTVYEDVDTAAKKTLPDLYNELSELSTSQLQDEGFSKEEVVLNWSGDLRYRGQSYELNAPLQPKDGAFDPEEVKKAFHQKHEEVHGYREEDEVVEIVNLRLTAIGTIPELRLRELPTKGEATPRETREVHFGDEKIETPIYNRDDLLADMEMDGPVIIEGKTSTCLVPPRTRAKTGKYGEIVVDVRGGQD